MANITWDAAGDRLYETGVSNCALYIQTSTGYSAPVAWNGITAISESPSGAESSSVYADNMKYLNLTSAEELSVTVEAYMYPEEFEQCDGTAELAAGVLLGQQSRKSFGLCYKTKIGNDVDGDAHGYKLHLIYGLKASPSEKAYSTINDSPEAITFSWECKATPVTVTGHEATSIVTVDSTRITSAKLTALESALLDDTTGTLLTPDAISTLMAS